MTGTAGRRSRVERIAAHEYAFTSVWHLAAPVDAVFEVLRDLWSYPVWWPEIIRAHQISEDEGEFALRSRLPLTLQFRLRRDAEDHRQRVLRAMATGDIAGSVEWRLRPTSTGTTINFTQLVTLEHPLARRGDLILRPLLTWNHRVAMSSGERGLIAHLDHLDPNSSSDTD